MSKQRRRALIALIALSLPWAAWAENATLAAQAPTAAAAPSLAKAMPLDLVSGLNALAARIPQGADLDPESLVDRISKAMAEPGADPALVRAGQAALAALSDPVAKAKLLSDLQGGDAAHQQAAKELARITMGSANVEARSAVAKAIARAGLSVPSLASLYDGSRGQGSELVEFAQAADNATARMGLRDYLADVYGPSKDAAELARGVLTDLTAMEAQPFAGRSKQASEVLAVLSRPDAQQRSVLLSGQLGVGKTFLIRHLASGVTDGTYALDAKFLELDVPKLASLFGQPAFEMFFDAVLPGLATDAVIVIRGLDRLLDADGKRILQRLEKPMEYDGQRFIFSLENEVEVPKGHFLRKFAESMKLEDPAKQEAMQMMLAHKAGWEKSFGVKILDSALEELIRISDDFLRHLHPQEMVHNMVRALSDRTATSRRNAAQAAVSDLYSQLALATAKYRRTNSVNDYNAVIALAKALDAKHEELRNPPAPELTGEFVKELLAQAYPEKANLIRNNKDHKARLLAAIPKLEERIIGQDPAVKAVGAVLKTVALGMDDEKGTMGTFLFLGPTGVGKTEIAKALAEAFSGSESSLIRLDMSEFMEKHNVSRMTGPPPGYAGYDEGGRLTEAVYKSPESVVLYDEIEKAHPDVFNALLQVFDDGRLTDGKGKTVDFHRTINIMTSNFGSQDILRMEKEGASYEEIAAYLKEAMENSDKFKPEFINRINAIVVFNSLGRPQIIKIGGLQTNITVAKPLARNGHVLLPLGEGVLDFIGDKRGGVRPEYGARPMANAIRNSLKPEVMDFLESQEKAAAEKGVESGKFKISVNVKDDKIIVTGEPKVEPPTPKSELPAGKLGMWLQRLLNSGAQGSPTPADIKSSYEGFMGLQPKDFGAFKLQTPAPAGQRRSDDWATDLRREGYGKPNVDAVKYWLDETLGRVTGGQATVEWLETDSGHVLKVTSAALGDEERTMAYLANAETFAGQSNPLSVALSALKMRAGVHWSKDATTCWLFVPDRRSAAAEEEPAPEPQPAARPQPTSSRRPTGRNKGRAAPVVEPPPANDETVPEEEQQDGDPSARMSPAEFDRSLRNLGLPQLGGGKPKKK